MSPIVWLVIWAVVILAVAFLYVREVRSKRKPIGEFDRVEHQAVGESLTMQQRTRARGQGLGC